MTEVLAPVVRALLETHWDDTRGFCVPNPATYPHLWLCIRTCGCGTRVSTR